MNKEFSTRNLFLLDSPGPSSPALRILAEHIFRQKRVLAGLLLLWTALMAAYLIFTPASYEAQIQFLINNNRAGTVVSPEYNNGPIPRDYVDETVVATEIQLLSNTELLRAVVKECGLAEAGTPAAQEKALKHLQKDLKVAPVLKSNMLRATYSSANPAEVKAVLESLANGYLSEHVRAHASAGVYDLFDQQAQHYQKQLKQLQTQLTAFHERRNIVTLAEQKDLNLRKLMELQASLKEAEAGLAANTRKITQLREQLASSNPRITTQARVVPNQYSVERLNTMLVELQNRRTEMAAKFQPQDRLIQEIDKQIAD